MSKPNGKVGMTVGVDRFVVVRVVGVFEGVDNQNFIVRMIVKLVKN